LPFNVEKRCKRSGDFSRFRIIIRNVCIVKQKYDVLHASPNRFVFIFKYQRRLIKSSWTKRNWLIYFFLISEMLNGFHVLVNLRVCIAILEINCKEYVQRESTILSGAAF
jgi:hypothetical protein